MRTKNLSKAGAFPRSMGRGSLTLLLVFLGVFLFFIQEAQAQVGNSGVMIQVWRDSREGGKYSVKTIAYLGGEKHVENGYEYVQIERFDLLFLKNGHPYEWHPDPWWTYWTYANVVTGPYPWPEGTIYAQFKDGDYVGLWSEGGVMKSVQIRPTNNPYDDRVSLSGSVLFHWPCCSDPEKYGIESTTIEYPPPCAPPPSGIVSWWDGDAVTGVIAHDIRGSSDGILMNGATVAPGQVGQAFSFEGDCDHVNLGNDPSLDLNEDLTIDAWIKAGDLDGRQPIVSKGDPNNVGGNSQEYYLFLFYSQLAFRIGNSTKTGAYVQIYRDIPYMSAGRWYHVAATVQGATARIYVNGVEIGADVGSGIRLTEDNFDTTIGMLNGADLTRGSFHGEIDATVFPSLGSYKGCLDLMRRLVRKRHFVPEATWLVATADAYCGTIQGIVDDGTVGAIQNVGVVNAHRGRGLGTALVLQALAGFRRIGLSRAFLDVTAENTGAVSIYEKLGFRTVKTLFKAVHTPG